MTKIMPMAEFERLLLNTHVCAETHSQAIQFAIAVGVPDMTIMKLLAAAVLRSNEEVEAFDEAENQQGFDVADVPCGQDSC